MEPDSQRSHPRLGFIGLGAMGSRMAGRLLAAGYDLTVFNRRRDERMRALEQRGATGAETPGAVAGNAEVILVSVTDDAAVEDVITGAEGALYEARAGTIFINMSTVSPALSRRLSETALFTGVSVLDAPVSGSTPQAEQGQLVIFVGGDQAVYERCRPILAVLGRESFYIGPAGSGSTMKLCVNALLGLGAQALGEAVVLGLSAGLDRDRLLDVLGATVVLSPSQRSKLDNVRMDTYPPAFPLRLMFKDFGLILDAAKSLSVAMPTTEAARQVCAAESARQRADGRDEDFSSVVRAMEQPVSSTRFSSTRRGHPSEPVLRGEGQGILLAEPAPRVEAAPEQLLGFVQAALGEEKVRQVGARRGQPEVTLSGDPLIDGDRLTVERLRRRELAFVAEDVGEVSQVEGNGTVIAAQHPDPGGESLAQRPLRRLQLPLRRRTEPSRPRCRAVSSGFPGRLWEISNARRAAASASASSPLSSSTSDSRSRVMASSESSPPSASRRASARRRRLSASALFF